MNDILKFIRSKGTHVNGIPVSSFVERLLPGGVSKFGVNTSLAKIHALLLTRDKIFTLGGLYIFWGQEEDSWVVYYSTGVREIFSSLEETLASLLKVSTDNPSIHVKSIDYSEGQTFLVYLREHRKKEMEATREKFKGVTYHHFCDIPIAFHPLSDASEGFLIFRGDKVHLLGTSWVQRYSHTYQGEEVDLLYGMLSYNQGTSYTSKEENSPLSGDVLPNTLLTDGKSFLLYTEEPYHLYRAHSRSCLTHSIHSDKATAIGGLPPKDTLRVVSPTRLQGDLKAVLRDYLLRYSMDEPSPSQFTRFIECHSEGIITSPLTGFSFYPLNSLDRLYYRYSEEEQKLSILGTVKPDWPPPDPSVDGFCFEGEDAKLVMAVIAYNCVYCPPF